MSVVTVIGASIFRAGGIEHLLRSLVFEICGIHIAGYFKLANRIRNSAALIKTNRIKEVPFRHAVKLVDTVKKLLRIAVLSLVYLLSDLGINRRS